MLGWAPWWIFKQIRKFSKSYGSPISFEQHRITTFWGQLWFYYFNSFNNSPKNVSWTAWVHVPVKEWVFNKAHFGMRTATIMRHNTCWDHAKEVMNLSLALCPFNIIRRLVIICKQPRRYTSFVTGESIAYGAYFRILASSWALDVGPLVCVKDRHWSHRIEFSGHVLDIWTLVSKSNLMHLVATTKLESQGSVFTSFGPFIAGPQQN